MALTHLKKKKKNYLFFSVSLSIFNKLPTMNIVLVKAVPCFLLKLVHFSQLFVSSLQQLLVVVDHRSVKLSNRCKNMLSPT